MNSAAASLIVLLSLCSCALAFASLPAASRAASFVPRSAAADRRWSQILPLRGGADGGEEEAVPAALEEEDVPPAAVVEEVEDAVDEAAPVLSAKSSPSPSVALAAALAPVTSALRSAGTSYSHLLGTRPILTKAVTASLIFGLSDWSAQQIEGSGDDGKTKKEKDWTRIVTASLVGLLYFGPAAHAWYETIFKILPGTSLVSTLQKAALGQLLFGPSFTCVFFATSLLQSGTFSLGSWLQKIRQDLPGAWAAGLSFWPLVDLVSYSLIPAKWIPLFVNFCSFVWTIYLSMVANRRRE
jgi:protein Mpv17